MGIRIAFFCGHKSRYGLAHLEPLLQEFDVRAVILGTEQRWRIFHESLGGRSYYPSQAANFRFPFARIIPNSFLQWLSGIRKQLRVRQMLSNRKSAELWKIFDVNSESVVQQLRHLDVDLFVSAAYPQIFTKAVVDIPKLGAVNFHPSLLPKYRGAHPHFWQIVTGEKVGGVTAHFMTERIDDGDVIAQLSFPIDNFNYSQLYDAIVAQTPELVRDVRVFFQHPARVATPQRSEEATYFRNDREIHARVFWSLHTSNAIHNLIRTGKAFCYFRGIKVNFVSSYVSDSNRNLTNEVRVESGTIVDIGMESLSIKTIDGCINITAMRMKQREFTFLQWAQKMKVSIGEKFE